MHIADAIAPGQFSQADLTCGEYWNFDRNNLGHFPPFHRAISTVVATALVVVVVPVVAARNVVPYDTPDAASAV